MQNISFKLAVTLLGHRASTTQQEVSCGGKRGGSYFEGDTGYQPVSLGGSQVVRSCQRCSPVVSTGRERALSQSAQCRSVSREKPAAPPPLTGPANTWTRHKHTDSFWLGSFWLWGGHGRREFSRLVRRGRCEQVRSQRCLEAKKRPRSQGPQIHSPVLQAADFLQPLHRLHLVSLPSTSATSAPPTAACCMVDKFSPRGLPADVNPLQADFRLTSG